MGTRFLPATKAQPKEMLPIIDKPIIQYLVEEVVSSGVKDVIFITGRGKRAIEDHFDFTPELEFILSSQKKEDAISEVREISELARFAYVRQNLPKGDGDAILCAKHLVGDNENVGIIFGDNITDGKKPCFLQMQEVSEKYSGIIMALERVPSKETSKYGVVSAKFLDDNIYEIKNLIEKPEIGKAPSDLVTIGKYIITPDVFSELNRLKEESKDKNEEIKLAYAIKNLIGKVPVYGLLFEGKRYDCGSKIGFLKATIELGLKHKEVGNELGIYLKNMFSK